MCHSNYFKPTDELDFKQLLLLFLAGLEFTILLSWIIDDYKLLLLFFFF
jgi:hypothetical protein